jgi:RNA polymerase sigma-70 factor (sigma-E family)
MHPVRDYVADRGEPAGFEDFFHTYHRELARLAYTLTGDRADTEDITSEAFASVWENWARVEAADNPLAYVRKIVVNLSALRIRRTIHERRGLARLGNATRWLEPAPDVGGMSELQAAILLLPARRRSCVVLRHVFDLSEDDVARCLGISTGTVKSQTARGLAHLRRTLTTTAEGGPRARRS